MRDVDERFYDMLEAIQRIEKGARRNSKLREKRLA